MRATPWFVCVLVCVGLQLAGTTLAAQRRAATALETIPGAFGVRFGAPLLGRVIIAPTSPPSIPVSAALRGAEPERRSGVPVRWRRIAPPTIPPLLKDRPAAGLYGALLDDSGVTVRIVGVIPAPDCGQLYGRVAAILEQRYGPGVDPDIGTTEAALADRDPPTAAARPVHTSRPLPGRRDHSGHKQRSPAASRKQPAAPPLPAPAPLTALFANDGNQVQVTCRDNQLVLDYLDGVAYPVWQRVQANKVSEYDRRQRLAVAAQVAAGRNGVIESAFGVRFGVPLALPGAVPDILARLHPPRPFKDWPQATYEVMLDPAGVPIRIAAHGRLPDAAAAFTEKARLVAALTEQYGPPIKDAPRHTVISSAGRLAVVDASADNEVLLMFVDSDRLQRQRLRFDMRRAELAEQSERQRAAEQAGF